MLSAVRLSMSLPRDVLLRVLLLEQPKLIPAFECTYYRSLRQRDVVHSQHCQVLINSRPGVFESFNKLTIVAVSNSRSLEAFSRKDTGFDRLLMQASTCSAGACLAGSAAEFQKPEHTVCQTACCAARSTPDAKCPIQSPAHRAFAAKNIRLGRADAQSGSGEHQSPHANSLA